MLTPDTLPDALKHEGFAFVAATDMRAQLEATGTLGDWETFTESWNDLCADTYMADKGRYRMRRYGVYSADANGSITREEHQPHYQSTDYNTLNGGVERWFEPIRQEIGAGESLSTVMRYCRSLFNRILPERAWHIEVHQFRIEAKAGEVGKPTPEGMHRDGVDYVCVLLIRRENILSGVTSIHDLEKNKLDEFTLTHPFDTALVDDRRVYHGVTAVEPQNPALPAYRDVLVVTFRAK